jgi:hypothetical protein
MALPPAAVAPAATYCPRYAARLLPATRRRTTGDRPKAATSCLAASRSRTLCLGLQPVKRERAWRLGGAVARCRAFALGGRHRCPICTAVARATEGWWRDVQRGCVVKPSRWQGCHLGLRGQPARSTACQGRLPGAEHHGAFGSQRVAAIRCSCGCLSRPSRPCASRSAGRCRSDCRRRRCGSARRPCPGQRGRGRAPPARRSHSAHPAGPGRC